MAHPTPGTVTPSRNKHATGFGLIEVLVALLILALGLLGLARLQADSLQHSHSATNSSHATFLAADVLDRIRANKSNAAAYAIGINDDLPGGNTTASQDLRAWKENINTLLTGARDDNSLGGSIVVNENTGTDPFFEVVVTLRWISARGEEDATDTGGENPRVRQFVVWTEI